MDKLQGHQNNKESQQKIIIKIQQTPLQDHSLREQLFKFSFLGMQSGFLYLKNNQAKEGTPVHSNVSKNSFFDAFYAAYCLHGDVMISADDIWLTINHQFGKEINKDAEKYRDLFVFHEGKKTLTINVDGTHPDWKDFPCQQNRWDIAMEMFSKEISNHTKGEVALLMKCDFSTSSLVEKSAANICLMSQMKNYFDYKMIACGCGIQNVHFLGGIEDFEYLASKIESLKTSFPLNNKFSNYLQEMSKIVNTFVEQMKDPSKVNLEFWNSIFDEKTIEGRGPSGIKREEQYFTGWIKQFFGGDNLKWYDIPKFYSEAPVKAIDEIRGKEYDLTFKTFFSGVEEVEPNVFHPITQIGIDYSDK